jgi:hypothetical protein
MMIRNCPFCGRPTMSDRPLSEQEEVPRGPKLIFGHYDDLRICRVVCMNMACQGTGPPAYVFEGSWRDLAVRMWNGAPRTEAEDAWCREEFKKLREGSHELHGK